MDLTIKYLEQRKEALQAQRDQLAAQLNAVIGAGNMLDELIASARGPEMPLEMEVTE